MSLNRDFHEQKIRECLEQGLEVCLVEDGDLTLRYLLRRKLNRTGPSVLLLGMNPGPAEKLAPEAEGGDQTTEKMLKEFDFDHLPGFEHPHFLEGLDALPIAAGELLFLNLLPVVEGTSNKVSKHLAALPAEDLEWLGDRSAQLIEELAQKADIIIPIWGAANAWKTVPLEKVRPIIKKLAQDPRKQVWAVRNDRNTPRHCGAQRYGYPWNQELLENFPFN